MVALVARCAAELQFHASLQFVTLDKRQLAERDGALDRDTLAQIDATASIAALGSSGTATKWNGGPRQWKSSPAKLQLHFEQPYNLAILDSNAANASISFLEALDTPDAG